jgi:hypothetical protein
MAKEAVITVRIPADLKRRLEARARREHRSLSSEIATVLERDLEQEPAAGGSPGRLLGLFRGRRVPTEEEFSEARRSLWGSLGTRTPRGRGGA